MAVACARSGPVVDATAIYHALVDGTDETRPRQLDLRATCPCVAPPWIGATIGFVNNHDDVFAMSTAARDYRSDTPGVGRRERCWSPEGDDDALWDTTEAIDWSRVRWDVWMALYLGGQTLGTVGPLQVWRQAVYESGEPADARSLNIREDVYDNYWNIAFATLNAALNFMNCRNVELVEPQRPRAEARRITRTGVTVQTINVFPVGKSTRSAKGEPVGGQPLTSVRGHFATYGPEHGRGLLFGKYTGRFWVPQHARGDKTAGERQPDYRLAP